METIGDFELYEDQLIGKGAWGEVFRGRQVSLDRPVAIKILKKELTTDEDFVKRFRREASVLAKLVDEHIIQVYGAGTHHDSHYFVMEYVQGVPLQKFMDRGRKFNAAEIIYVGLSVAQALKTAWETQAKIVHRDIKPSNIMVSFSSSVVSTVRPPDQSAGTSNTYLDFNITESRIKVMDFGLAKLVKEEKDATIVGTVIGTPKYISPEQGLGKAADVRSDIYSLGIVLYEMATGKIPFESETVMSLIRHHIYDTPLAPSQMNQELPAGLESIILKCIQKEPEQRYLSPNDLIADLEAVKQQQTPLYAFQKTGDSKIDATIISSVVKKARRKKTILLAAGGVVLLLAGGATVLMLQKTNKPHSPSGVIADSPAVATGEESKKIAGLVNQTHQLIKDKKFSEAHQMLGQLMMLAPGSEEVIALVKELAEQEKSSSGQLTDEIRRQKFNDLIKQVEILMKANNLSEASKVLSEAYVLDLDSPRVNELLNELKSRQSVVTQGQETRLKFEEHLKKGRQYFQNGDLTQAGQSFSSAYALIPDDPELNALLKELKVKEAQFQAEAERKKKEEEYNNYIRLGIESLSTKNWPAAVESFKKAMSIRDTEEVREKLTEASARLEQSKKYREIIGRGDEKERKGDFEKAIELYEESKKYAEDLNEPQRYVERCYDKLYNKHFQAGEKYLKEKKLIGARQSFEKSLQYKPRDKTAETKISDIDSKFPPNMVFVEAGEFLQGKDKKKIHLDSFFVDKYEVTNEEYGRFLADIKKTGNHKKCHPNEKSGSKPKDHTPKYWSNGEFPSTESKFPVAGVDWYDAYAYAAWAEKRLPTSQEWEKSARGTDGRNYPWGNSSEQVKINVKGNGQGQSAAVGQFSQDKSPYQCFDMGGNVAEWTADVYPLRKDNKTVRGGSWYDVLSKARCDSEDCALPIEPGKNLGFRCAKSVD